MVSMRKRLIRFSEADPATSRAELLRWIKKRSALLAIFSGVLIFALLLVFWASNRLANRLLASYEAQRSVIMYDRNGRGIAIKPNVRGYYARYAQVPFERFIALLLAKEDRYFYRHVGVNPISIARAGIRYFLGDSRTANSTITQQLVKILLGNEQSRSIKNKIKEVVYAMALELHTSKREILTMYQNSAYFGNRAQGVKEAAQFYFGTESEALSDIEWLALVATLQSPSDNYPGTSDNKTMLSRLALEMGIPNGDDRSLSLSKALSFSQRRDDAAFELETTGVSCKESCHLTIDRELTRSVRAILNRDLEKSSRGVHNGAVIVIKLPENEVLALVGSPNP